MKLQSGCLVGKALAGGRRQRRESQSCARGILILPSIRYPDPATPG